MINKKNVLGKVPDQLGVKDAIHTAIVAVRAGAPIRPGQRCGPNERREFVPSDAGPGVADPFLRSTISTGDSFWLLLAQDEIPNVQYVWDHPTIDFSPPSVDPVKNRCIQEFATAFGVSYEQLMDAAKYVVANGVPLPYPGNLPEDAIKQANHNARYDFWSEWSDETGHEFENYGTICCPEYDYPECGVFKVAKRAEQ